MRKVTLERQRQRRRSRLARFTILVALLLVAWGCMGTVLNAMPVFLWGVIAAGVLVAVWLVYALRQADVDPELGYAYSRSLAPTVIRLSLALGILVSLALAVLGWAMALKS